MTISVVIMVMVRLSVKVEIGIVEEWSDTLSLYKIEKLLQNPLEPTRTCLNSQSCFH